MPRTSFMRLDEVKNTNTWSHDKGRRHAIDIVYRLFNRLHHVSHPFTLESRLRADAPPDPHFHSS